MKTWSSLALRSVQMPISASDSLIPESEQGCLAGMTACTYPPATTFRFALYGKLLPRIEDAVRVGECMKVAVMSCAKQYLGAERIPPLLSGHSLPEENAHAHAFFLPEDADGDGRIDHLLVHVPAGLSGSARQSAESLRRLWNRDGQEWKLVFEGAGSPVDFNGQAGSRLCGCAHVLESITPYLMPWHAKKGFGYAEQVRRECAARHLPDPIEIEPLPRICIAGRERAPAHFYRFRTRRRLTQADTHGAFLRLTFAERVEGPLALGFACHFGLGLFAPASDAQT